MATTYTSERSHIAGLLSTWTDCPINWPNDALAEFTDRALPTPTGNPLNPARWLNLEINTDIVEQVVFSGADRVDGSVIIEVWVEIGVGDGKQRAMIDALVAIFLAGDGNGIQFARPNIGKATYHDEADWYIRVIEIPFVRFTDS